MKKINIIRKTQEFEKIIKLRHQYSNCFFVVYREPRKQEHYRIGIAVPKKVGNSVLRNKIKRQIKSIIDNNKNINQSLDYVIIIKKEILPLNYVEKKENLNNLFKKIDGVCKNEKS